MRGGMDDHHDGGGEIRRQVGEHGRDGLDASRRGADDYDVAPIPHEEANAPAAQISPRAPGAGGKTAMARQR